MAALCVRKFRRAPYGTGKFRSALKECLRSFLQAATADHPLVQRFGPSIAADHGLPPDIALTDPAALWEAMRGMLTERLGPKACHSDTSLCFQGPKGPQG
eukprot:15461042-Alexandrium_andersonii.AAC.1